MSGKVCKKGSTADTHTSHGDCQKGWYIGKGGLCVKCPTGFSYCYLSIDGSLYGECAKGYNGGFAEKGGWECIKCPTGATSCHKVNGKIRVTFCETGYVRSDDMTKCIKK